MKLLTGRTALITGAGSARGIGRATAKLFHAHGAKLALLDIDGPAVEALAGELGPDTVGLRCDVRDARACHDAVKTAAQRLPPVDVLISNAGVVHGTPFEEISQGEYDEVLDVNLRGSFNVSRAVVPGMKALGGGRIVCVSSIAGQVGGGVFGSAHYAAAKAGIFGLAKALARELAPHGIRANAIAPGPLDNDFTGGRMDAQMKRAVAMRVPLRRLGRPEDIADAALYLASDMSAWVTGTVIEVNGGLLIH
jgi:NAD(P)-dependent dehydrogenase (short-subunit alcohol dehydrogenase family)